MEGRWSLILSCGLAGSLAGCSSLSSRQPNGVPTVPTPSQAKIPQPNQVAAAGPAKNGKLKPSTQVAMGALSEQLADDTARPNHEREQFRDQARHAYQKAIETDPKYVPAYLALAKSYHTTDERDKALNTYKKAQTIAPNDAAVWAEMGVHYASIKEWDSAIDSMTQAAKLAPDNKLYTKTLAFTLARTGRTEEACAAFSKVMSEAEARFNIARMLEHVQQPEACRGQLQLSLKANPDYDPARDMLVAMNGGSDSGDTAGAVKQVGFTEPGAKSPPSRTFGKTTKAGAPSRLPPVILGGAETSPASPQTGGVIE